MTCGQPIDVTPAPKSRPGNVQRVLEHAYLVTLEQRWLRWQIVRGILRGIAEDVIL